MENVRRIVLMRGDGLSLRQIAKVLTDEGHKTKKNKTKWSAQAISDILERSVPDED
jgi:hypothetical protein